MTAPRSRTDEDYAAVGVPTDARWCIVDDLSKFGRRGDLSKAVSMRASFPNGLKVDLSRDGGDLVTDFVSNIFNILIASEKAKRLLESEGIGEGRVEYLPIVLRDKRGKAFKEPFFIINLLTMVSCFDWERSTYQTFEGRPREILHVNALHVRTEAIPEDAKLFRVAERRYEAIIRADLLQRLKSEGCDGIRVIPMGQPRIF